MIEDVDPSGESIVFILNFLCVGKILRLASDVHVQRREKDGIGLD